MSKTPELQQGVVLDMDTLHPEDLDLSRLKSSLNDWQVHGHTSATQVAGRIRDAHIVISNKAPLDSDTLATASNLKLICVAATGVNNVDLEAASGHGIAVCNATSYATPSVVEHVFALILALTRRLEEHRAATRAGQWNTARDFCHLDFPVRELAGRSIGIIGYGELGRAVARVAETFGMNVMIAQRPGGPAQPGRHALNKLLPQVDILSLHCPLTTHTRNLIDSKQLALMKGDALLINTARGGIVNEHALALAVSNGTIGGAGVDVLEKEPPVNGSPLLDVNLPNLIVTPHVAWSSRESRQRLVDQVVENIQAFKAGNPRNLVNEARIS